MSTELSDIYSAIDGLRDDLATESENAAERRTVCRPLPDAVEVARYLNASRAAAKMHLYAMNAGQKDLAVGTAQEALLYRQSSLYGLPKPRSEQPPYRLRDDALAGARDLIAEMEYRAVILEDALQRLDPKRTKHEAATAAHLTALLAEIVESADRLRMLLALGNAKQRPAVVAAIREHIIKPLLDALEAEDDVKAEIAALYDITEQERA